MKNEEAAMRILRALSDADEAYIDEAIRFREKSCRASEKFKKVIHFPVWAGTIAAAAACLVIFAAYNFIGHQQAGPEEGQLACGTPYIEADTIEEAEEKAGFAISAPETIASYVRSSILVYNDNMIQISYAPKNGDDSECIIIRKAEGSEDISGDFNTYTENAAVRIEGRDITLKGNDGMISLATWTADNYSFSVSTGEQPMTYEEMSEVIREVR